MSAPETITTTLTYHIDNGKRQSVSLSPAISTDEATAFSKPISTVIRNARIRTPAPTLDQNGFQLLNQKTSLSQADFLDDKKVKEQYFPEVAALICAATGARECKIFHHQVRSGDAKKSTQDGKFQKPAGAVHSDYSTRNAFGMYDSMCPKEYIGKGKYCVINSWRNISGEHPIENDHLAMCEASSICAPDDYIPLDLYLKNGTLSETYRLDASRAHLHRWFYYPNMKKDEVLLFMQYNSDPKSQARITFHSSIRDPTSKNTTFFRESIETRTICFFPDFPINTIPRMVVDGESMVNQSVKKIVDMVNYLPDWDENGRAWIRGMYFSDPQTGPEKTIRHLVDEHVRKKMREGTNGEKMSDETFEEIVQKLIKEGEFKQVVELHLRPYDPRELVEEVAKNLTNGLAPQVVKEHWDNKDWAKSLVKRFGLDEGAKQIAQALVKYSCENSSHGLNPKTSPEVSNQVVAKCAASAAFKENCRLSFG